MRQSLAQLAQSIEALQSRASGQREQCHLSTGWPALDETLGGGLKWGAIHEWIGHSVDARLTAARQRWFAPMMVLIHLAGRALCGEPDAGKFVVWIGRRCWPFASSVQTFEMKGHASHGSGQQSDRGLSTFPNVLEHSLFLDPPDEASRLWAMDLALRSPSVSMAVADGSGMQMPHTRRLQLAAESGGAIGLLARSPREINVITAAMTRWRVKAFDRHEDTKARRHAAGSVGSCMPSVDVSTWRIFEFSLELLRCKGVRPVKPSAAGEEHPRAWIVEFCHEKGGIDLSADVASRSASAAA